jgi:hypothetical protein
LKFIHFKEGFTVRILQISILSVLLAIVSGCATMSASECVSADWYQRGVVDGQAGQAPDYVESHREACAEVNIRPDVARWQAGWQQGVVLYCTPNAAWAAGVSGQSYRGVCTGLDEGTFLRYHRAGRLVWRARQDLNQNRAQISRLEDQLRRATSDDERRRFRDELNRAENERNRLTAHILVLELAGPPR